MRSIVFDKCSISREIFREDPVRADQFFAEFTVTVDVDGCYAIDVKLLDHDSLTPNEEIAGSDVPLRKCFCFSAHQPRKFHIYGAAPPPPPPLPNSPPDPIDMPSKDSTSLPAIKGVWPEDDGIGDNEIEVFVRVRVLLCQFVECASDAACEPRDIRELEDNQPFSPLMNDSEKKDVYIKNGRGGEKVEKMIEEMLKAAPGAASQFGFQVQSPSQFFVQLERRVRKLERGVTRRRTS